MGAIIQMAKDLGDYQSHAWAIGFSGQNMAPDPFIKYFSDHSLPFEIYFAHGFVELVVKDAYMINLKTLADYRAK